MLKALSENWETRKLSSIFVLHIMTVSTFIISWPSCSNLFWMALILRRAASNYLFLFTSQKPCKSRFISSLVLVFNSDLFFAGLDDTSIPLKKFSCQSNIRISSEVKLLFHFQKQPPEVFYKKGEACNFI